MNHLTASLVKAHQPILILQRGLKKSVTIPVTLLKDIPRVGKEGDVVQVGKAYMRHDLYPKRLADYIIKYKGPLDRSKAKDDDIVVKQEGTTKAQIDTQQRIHNIALHNQSIIQRLVDIPPLVFECNVVVGTSSEDAPVEEGSAQHIYGSVTKADVLRSLEEKYNIKIEKDALSMDERIKTTGEYICTVKLIYAGQITFKINIVPAQQESQ